MADYSANLTPIYRISKFLDRLVHGTDAPEPVFRIEFYLAKLAGQDVEIPEPIYRIEFYLAKLCGMDVEIPVPIYRAEFYLAKLCGEEVTPPEVIYRISHWLADWAESGGGGAYYTLTGTLPLTLPHSLAAAIRSLTRYGAMTQTPTPTPDAPVYPTINNGTVAMVHRSGLPSGYKLLEYVGSSGSAYVVTDVYLASTDVVEAEFRNNSTTGYGSLYGVFKLGDSSALYANQTYYGYDESNNKVDTDIRVNTDWHTSRHDFVNGTLAIDDTTVTFTPFEFANSVQNAVLARYYNNSYGYIWKGFIRKFKVTRGGEVICDLLPAKNEQDEAGLYDLVSGNFYTATSGTLVAGDEVNDYEPAVVGDPEVLTVGKNLFSQDSYLDAYCTAGGTITAHNSSRCFVMECKPNTEYRFIFDNSATSSPRCIINGFAAQPKIGMRSTQVCYSSSNTSPMLHDTTFTTDADVHYLVMWLMYQKSDADTKAAVNKAIFMETATAQTATVPNLYAVGDYKDEVDVISGTVTRRVGMKELTGNEEWTAKDQYNRVSIVADDMSNPTSPRLMPAVCTHYENIHNGEAISTITAGQFYTAAPKRLYFHISEASTADFKAYLAAQYAAGTPVVVWYPLATPYTESIAGQHLRTVDGTTVVDSSAGAVSASVEYKASEEPSSSTANGLTMAPLALNLSEPAGLTGSEATDEATDEAPDDGESQEETEEGGEEA